MATSNQTLQTFYPKDVAPSYPGSVSIDRKNNLDVLRFGDNSAAQTFSPTGVAVFDGILPAGTNAGYTATTGLKVVIGWVSRDAKVAGAVRWAASFQLNGQTDLPDPTVGNFPAASSANEIAVNSTVNATVAGGMNYTTISVPIASIMNGQTTAPAVGDAYRLRVRRANLVGDTAGDTMVGTAFVLSVAVQDY